MTPDLCHACGREIPIVVIGARPRKDSAFICIMVLGEPVPLHLRCFDRHKQIEMFAVRP